MPRRNNFHKSGRGHDTDTPTPRAGLFERARYALVERGRSLFKRRAYTIAFLPSKPRAEHLIWGANCQAGGRIIKNPHKADAVFYFDEKIKARPPRRPNPLAPGFNFFCPDTSQKCVAKAFKTVFGYDLGVDPEIFEGQMAAKVRRRGRTQIEAVQGPCPREPRVSYQALVDNELHGGYVVEFRCPVVKGEIPLAYVAMRPTKQRFGQKNKSTAIVPPGEVFTSTELSKISRFCAEIGLDWGGLDILRDKNSGQIYIVDVDRAEMEAPHALSFEDRLRSTEILGQALREAIIDQPGIIPRAIPISSDQPAMKPDNDTEPKPRVHDLDIVPVRISS